MMNIVSQLTVLMVLFVLVCDTSSKQNDETTAKRQEKSMQFQLKNYQVKERTTTMWPSFNDSSYVYILGLFLKQKSSLFTIPEERAMFMSAILLSQQKNITLNGKQFAYRLEETNARDVMHALDRTCLSMSKNQILGIVGPSGSNEAKTIARFCNRAGLPVLGYSTTDPELSDRNAYETFYRMSVSDIIMAQALLKLFQKYNWNSTNIIYQDDSYGQGGLQALSKTFGGTVEISRKIKYDIFANEIENFRRQLEESSSRIVLLWADPNITTNIIELALAEGNILAPHFLWIMTATNSRMHLNDKQLTGMLLIRPVSPQVFGVPINGTLLKDAVDIWKTYDPQSYIGNETHIDAFALYAFDSAWMLILAFNELCQQNPSDCPSLLDTSHCFASYLTNRNKLHTIMQTMNFLGVSGHVQFSENITDRLERDVSHFIIDNLQLWKSKTEELHAVEVLKLISNIKDPNHKYDAEWIEIGDTIQWPKGVDKVPLDYAVLKDQTLNITVYISPPFYMEKPCNYSNGTSGIEQQGYIIDLISLLEKRMNFTRNIKVAPIESSYNDLVDCVQNRTHDIVMADLTRTADRLEKIDFSVSIYANTMRMVVRKGKQVPTSIMGFLKPFHYSLWLGIFAVMYLFSAIIITIFEFHGREKRTAPNTGSPGEDIYDQSIIITFFRSLYHTIGALVQRDAALPVTTVYARLQTVVVWLMSFILIALFTGNMVQYFAMEYEKPRIQSIEDLKMCRKIECNRIGVIENSQHADYFKKEVISDADIDYYRLKHPNECYKKLLDYYIDVAIADSSSTEYFTQTDYCDLEEAGLPFGRTDFAIAIPKNWPYKTELDKTIIDLKASSAFDSLLAKWFQQKNCDRKNEIQYNGFGDGLTLKQTQGLFYIFGGFTMMNILVFILHKCCSLSFRQRCLSVHKIREYLGCLCTSSLDQQPIDARIEMNDQSGNNQSRQQIRHKLEQLLPVVIPKSHEEEQILHTKLQGSTHPTDSLALF